MPLGREVGLNPSDIVLDRGPASLPKKGTEPPSKFSARDYCGQTAGWIKMPLGMEVGLGPGHVVVHGDPALPPKRGHSHPIFGRCLLWSNGRPSQLLLSTCKCSVKNFVWQYFINIFSLDRLACIFVAVYGNLQLFETFLILFLGQRSTYITTTLCSHTYWN